MFEALPFVAAWKLHADTKGSVPPAQREEAKIAKWFMAAVGNFPSQGHLHMQAHNMQAKSVCMRQTSSALRQFSSSI